MALLLIAGSTFNLAFGQVPPPYPNPVQHITTVDWIHRHKNDLSADDRRVTLVGNVIRPTGEESYWFSDGTGTIRLDSERFELPLNQRIIVTGRVDEAFFGFGHLEVDVRSWYPARGLKLPPPYRR